MFVGGCRFGLKVGLFLKPFFFFVGMTPGLACVCMRLSLSFLKLYYVYLRPRTTHKLSCVCVML